MKNADRERKKMQFTLSDQARQLLQDMSTDSGKNMSQIVDELIVKASKRPR